MNFDVETFLDLLSRYNLEKWPMQIVVYIAGLYSVFLSLKPSRYSSEIISSLLAFFWLWTGIVFNFFYWSEISATAYIAGALFVIQGIFILVSGVIKADLSFRFKSVIWSWLGLFMILYAMVGYPVIGSELGHTYPAFFCFGIVPCPTVVFTFGLFLCTEKKIPPYLLVIPLLWSLIGIVPVMNGIYEDIGMIIFGITGTLLILVRDKKAITY